MMVACPGSHGQAEDGQEDPSLPHPHLSLYLAVPHAPNAEICTLLRQTHQTRITTIRIVLFVRSIKLVSVL
jgi:hypothetical protein